MKSTKTVSKWITIGSFAAIALVGSAGMASANAAKPAPKPKPALAINNVDAQGESAVNSTKTCAKHIDSHGNSYRAKVNVPYSMNLCLTNPTATATGTSNTVSGTFEIQMQVGVAKGTVTGTRVDGAKTVTYDLNWHVTGGTRDWAKATGDVHLTGTGKLPSPHANNPRLMDTLKLAGSVQS